MIAYFRIRKVLKSLQDFIVSEHFQCKTEVQGFAVVRLRQGIDRAGKTNTGG